MHKELALVFQWGRAQHQAAVLIIIGLSHCARTSTSGGGDRGDIGGAWLIPFRVRSFILATARLAYTAAAKSYSICTIQTCK